MAEKRIRILHLSDLHLGKERASQWRMRRVLDDAWHANLDAIRRDGPIDLVCFTGDLAQSGKPEQYAEAAVFVDELLSRLAVPRERFFCVPGNHDVDRGIGEPHWQEHRTAASELNEQAFALWMAGGKAPRGCDDAWREAVLERQAAYRRWLVEAGFERFVPANNSHGRFGYRVSLDVGAGAPLNIVGLDSAWLAGDDKDSRKLRLTDEQIGRLLTVHGRPLEGWTMALVHHPLSDLADEMSARRLLSEYGVSLLLHGHLHDPELARWATPANKLHISSAGCLYEHDRYPNSLQVLDVALLPPDVLEPTQLWARAWSARGHWHDDDSLYPGSSAGRLRLRPDSAHEVPFVSGSFVGRSDELTKLCEVLLPKHGAARATIVCCAIEGMPGVGKTRLAEEFLRRHWLPACGVSDDDNDLHAHCIRLVIDPLVAPRSAEELAQDIADRLRSVGPAETLFARLSIQLQAVRQLLLIENVDTAENAQAVAKLVNRLPDCPILVTARYRQIGGTHWARVEVPPLPKDAARKLLLSEIEPGGYPLSSDEADELGATLGYLPLALHIAASYLNLGHSPASFVEELRKTGLKLEPAQPGDLRLSADRARAILHSSFAVSWALWCEQRTTAWQEALVALAHGPAASTGLSLSAAITALPENEYLPFALSARRASLLEYSPGDQRATTHPLIAEYLRAQPVPDAATMRLRMTAWFSPRLHGSGDENQGQAWRQVQAETDALAHWLAVLPFAEGLEVERAGSSFAMHAGPYLLWYGFCERMLAATNEASQRSNILWTQANLALRAGKPNETLAIAREKQALDRTEGNEREAAVASSVIADVLMERGELDETLRIVREEQLPVFEKLGDVRERAVCLGRIADVLMARGELDEALRILRGEVLTSFEKLGVVRERAVALGKIADVLMARGELDEALRIRREEQLPVYEKLGDVRERAVTLGKIADVLMARGELDEALRIRREEQLPVYEKLGDVRLRAVTLGKIADVLMARGEFDEALRIRREEQLPVFEKLGDVRSRAVTLGQIADVLMARGELDEALRIRREEELPVYEKLGDVRSRALTLGKIADVLMARGELDETLRILRGEVLTSFEKLGDMRSRAVTLGKIADVLMARGELDEALRILRGEVLTSFEKLGDLRSLLVGQVRLAINLNQHGREEDKPEIDLLLLQALKAAESMQIPEAAQIREMRRAIFG